MKSSIIYRISFLVISIAIIFLWCKDVLPILDSDSSTGLGVFLTCIILSLWIGVFMVLLHKMTSLSKQWKTPTIIWGCILISLAMIVGVSFVVIKAIFAAIGYFFLEMFKMFLGWDN